MKARIVAAAAVLLILSACALTPGGARDRYFARGKRSYDQGNWADASLNFRKAIRRDARFGDAYYYLGLAEVKRQGFQEAFRALYRAAELNPQNTDAKVKFADICLTFYVLDSRRPKFLYDQISKISKDLLGKDPKSFDGLRYKAEMARAEGRLTDAIAVFREADGRKPGQPEIVLSLAQTLIGAKQAAEGEKLAAGYVDRRPDFGPMYDVLYLYYLQSSRNADAENILKRKLENIPGKPEYIQQLAAHYFQSNRRSEGAAVLQRMLDDSKTFPQARFQIGDFYFRMGDLSEAIVQYEAGAAAAASVQDKSQYRKRVIEVYLTQKRFDAAMKIVEQLLREDPKDVEVVAAQAFLLLESGKTENGAEAVKVLKGLNEKLPGNINIRYNLARAYQLTGDLGAAWTQYREVLRRQRDYAPAQRAMVELSFRGRRFDDALRYAEGLLSKGATEPRLKLLRAVALMNTGRFEESKAELQKLLELFPTYRDAQLQYALVLIAQRKFGEAETIFRKLYEPGGKDSRALEGLVQAFVVQNQFSAAFGLLSEELRKSPGSVKGRMLMADTAFAAGKFDLAIQHYRELLAMDPASAEMMFRLAMVYRGKGDLNEAVSLLEKCKGMAKDDAKMPGMLGAVLQEAGRLEEAKTQYRRSLDLLPNNPSVSNNLAFLIAETGGNLDEALQQVQNALAAAPENPDFADTMGLIYLRKKHTDSAVQVFSKLVTKNPENPVYRYHFAVSLVEKGDLSKARMELNAALRSNPPKAEERRIVELLNKIG